MAMQVPPELEKRVTALAVATQRDPQSLLAELLDTALDDNEALRLEVHEGLAELERGEGIEHGAAMLRLRTALERGSRPQ